jgi:hypothetical protein
MGIDGKISIISHRCQYEQCWAERTRDDVLWREECMAADLLLEGTSRYNYSYPRAACSVCLAAADVSDRNVGA